MPERTVKVNLVAQVNGYLNGMEMASRRTRELGTEAEKLAQKREGFEQLGRSMLMFGAIAAAAVGIAIKKFADFDQAMSQVNAVTQESASNLNLLRDAALDAGGATVFTATEAANAIEELGKAGLSTADILGGALTGALTLAASGQLEVARAAEITATTLKQYALAGDQAGHVADVLSAGAGKALGSVEDLAQALKFVGPVAASMGVSLEETTGALALFADQGIIGEQAGTSLRGAISSLVSPSAEASKEIEKLKINLFDSNNAFIGVAGTAGQLADAYKGMDEKSRSASLGLIFGNQQLTAARILFGSGSEAVKKYTDEVNDAGYAARVAADRMDNLSGDVEKLGGAFDTFLIKSGSGANELLRSLTQSVTFLVDAASGLPQPVLDAGLAIGTVAAVTALAGGAALVAVPKWASFRSVMNLTAVGARSATLAIVGVGAAIGVATIVISKFVEMAAEYNGGVDSLADSFDKATGAATDYTRALQIQTLEGKNALKFAEDMGISADLVTDAAMGNKAAYAEVKAQMDAYYNSQTDWISRSNTATAMGEVSGAIDYTNKQLDDAHVKFERVTKATNENVDSTETAASAYSDAAKNVADLQSELDQLIDTINKANGIGQDAVSTNAAYQDALAGVGTEVQRQKDAYEEANGTLDGYVFSLDEATAAGSANADMFADLAKKSQDAAKAQFDLDGNTETYIARLNDGRQTLYDQIVALTGNADAAQALTDKVYAIPSEKEIKFIADTRRAAWTVDDFIAQMGQKVGVISFRAELPDLNGVASGNGRMGTFASGGYTGDIPAGAVAGVVHGREFVNNDESTSKPSNRAAMEFMNAGGDISNYVSAPTYVSAPASVQERGGVNVTIPIAPSPGMSELTLVNILDRKLNRTLRGK